MIEIQLGLPDELRISAIGLYYRCFTEKLNNFLSEDEALCILPDLLNSEQAIIALQEGKLMGFAGIQPGQQRLFRLPLRPFVKHLGIFRGIVVTFVLKQFGRPYKEGELLMDGICVAKGARGQGIGSRLLEAVFEFARQNDYRTVRLDVVDTNPGARRLYERLGFRPTATERYPFLKRLMGFSAATTMIKNLW